MRTDGSDIVGLIHRTFLAIVGETALALELQPFEVASVSFFDDFY